MAPNDKPRDKGLGEYAKDFVGGLLGRDDDDNQAAATQRERAQQDANQPERPRDKGIGEYTKDFVGGLFGRDDADDQPKTQAAPKKDEDMSFAERVQQDARAAAERAQAQAQSQAQQQQGGGSGSIFDRAREAADEAAKRAQEAQQKPGTSAAPRSSFDQPAKPATAGDDQSEVERLRARVADLERQQGAGQAAESKQRTYVVKPGDSLSLIAKRFYGDPMQWKRIYEANRGTISNPDLIHPDQEFIIPE